MIDRGEAWIARLGTRAGLRAVVGHWPRSPFGAFSAVVVERPDRHRALLAPPPEVARYYVALGRSGVDGSARGGSAG